jgi:ComF family protein
MFYYLKQLLNWVYKSNCYICKKTIPEGCLCMDCLGEIESLGAEPVKNVANVEIYAKSLYAGNLRKIIKALKYHDKKEFAKPLASMLYELWQEINPVPSDEEVEIIPVPLHKNRQKSRKYNHMELISNEFSKLSGVKTNTGLLKRVKDTKPQYKLTTQERKQNLKDAFEVNKSHYHDKTVLIIDDITTTGATLEEIIKEFRKNGINKVKAIVISTATGEKYL